MKVLVIGAGPAGLRCAMRIADRRKDAEITLVGEEAAPPYDRVALSRLLAGEIDAAALMNPSLATIKAKGISYLQGVRISTIDRATGIAITSTGVLIPYDRLVLATGSQALRLPIPGADLAGVLTYRTLDDAATMMRVAEAGGAAVVIGGGLLGLEAAAGLAARGMRVTVVHAVDWPMERQLDAAAGALLTRHMGGKGIDFAMPARTASIEGEAHVSGIRLTDGHFIPAQLVVMAVGIKPATWLAEQAGLLTQRGVVVDAAMRTSDPSILAIGECAEHEGRLIGLVAPALDQAEVAAATIAEGSAIWMPRAESAVLKVSGAAVWSAGDITDVSAESITLRDEEEDHYRRLLLRNDCLVGAVLYGDTDDSGFYMDLIASCRPITPFRANLAFGPAFVPVLVS